MIRHMAHQVYEQFLDPLYIKLIRWYITSIICKNNFWLLCFINSCQSQHKCVLMSHITLASEQFTEPYSYNYYVGIQ